MDKMLIQISLDGHDIQLEEKMRLLGVIIRSDMKWSSNTENVVKKVYDLKYGS
jgi:hypothetical protein